MHLYQWVFSWFCKPVKAMKHPVFVKHHSFALENECYETRNSVNGVKLIDGIGSL